jgi:hypothetical protein
MPKWSDLPHTFRALCSHTFYCALTLLSFIGLFKLAHWGVEPGRVLLALDKTEDVVLVVVYVYFAIVLIYQLTQERVRAFIEFVVKFVASHRAVLA